MGCAFVYELSPNQKPSLKSKHKSKSIADFITECNAAGCYTTMRTADSTKILCFEEHVSRLARVSGLADLKPCGFRELLLRIFSGLKELPEWSSTQKICVTVGQTAQKITHLGIYLEELSPCQNSRVIALFHPKRHEPNVKSTDWISVLHKSERKDAISRNIPPYEEVLIVDLHGKIYEGLSSNFGVVCRNQNTIRTAPFDHVLKGTIMQLIFEASAELGYAVHQDFPSIFECEQWKGCFISSTSRMLLPVSSLSYYGTDGGLKTVAFETKLEIFDKINRMLQDRVQQCAPLF